MIVRKDYVIYKRNLNYKYNFILLIVHIIITCHKTMTNSVINNELVPSRQNKIKRISA